MSSEGGNSAQEDFPQVKDPTNMNSYAQGITIKNSYSTELETAALEQMAYDSNFTEDINVKMRIPEKLTVDQQPSDEHYLSSAYGNNRPQNIQATFNMEVPDRIVVSVGEQGVKYSQSMNAHNPLYSDNYASSIPSNDHVTLATPPRKLTLAETNMDSLEIQEAPIEGTKAQNQGHNRSNHKLSDSSLSYEIGVRSFQFDRNPVQTWCTNVQLSANSVYSPSKFLIGIKDKSLSLVDRILHGFNSANAKPNMPEKYSRIMTSLTTCNTTRMTSAVQTRQKSSVLMDPLIPSVHNESLEDLDDITMLRRQVFKLHRRITKMEKQETERSRREIYLYAITVGFWLLNGWFIYNNRRIY